MATYYGINAGGNWNTAGTWSTISAKDVTRTGATGATPTATDDIVLDDYSGNITVNATTCLCKSLDCAVNGNYAGQLTLASTNILTSSGSVKFVSTMTFSGATTANLVINATASLWSGTLTLPFSLKTSTAITITLQENITTSGHFVTGSPSAGQPVLNGYTLYVGGNFTISSGSGISGTTAIIMNGTGTFSSAATALTCCLGLALTLNSYGTITRGNFCITTGGSLTYTAGTYVPGTSALIIFGNCTLNVSAIDIYSITISANATITLSSALTGTGTFSVTGTSPAFAGAYNIQFATLAFVPALTNKTITLVAGTTLTITTAINALNANNLTGTILSGTASSTAYFVYNGTVANCKVAILTFTDITYSGSTQTWFPNWFGGTLTRTSGIYNITPASFPAIADVRSGTAYAGGALTGTMSAGGSVNDVFGII
jgi:hypothetical protein